MIQVRDYVIPQDPKMKVGNKDIIIPEGDWKDSGLHEDNKKGYKMLH